MDVEAIVRPVLEVLWLKLNKIPKYLNCRVPFLVGLVVILHKAEGDTGMQEYRIEKFLHNPGMYLEKQGVMYHSSEQWKLVVRLDVTALYERISQARRFLLRTREVCVKEGVFQENKGICESLHEEFLSRELKIRKIVDRVKIIVGTSTRSRRGLVDAIGSVSKVLFGTMDAEDDKRITEQLSLVTNNQAILQHTIKNQLRVVNATIAHIGSIEDVIERNENRLREALEAITEKMDRYTQQQQLDEYFTELGSILTELEFDADNIMEYITNAQAKFAQLTLLPAEQVVANLRNASNLFSPEVHFPFVPALENWLTVKEFATVSVYCRDSNVFTILKFPLVTSVTYNVFKVIPLPVHEYGNVFSVMKVEHEIVAVDTNRQTYAILTVGQLAQCKDVQSCYVCENVEPIYRLRADAPCEVQAFVSEASNYKSCKPENVVRNRTVWIRLETSRTWLYSTLDSESVLVSCENQTEKGEVVNGVGKIELPDRCRLSTEDMTIHTNKVIKNVQVNTFLPRFNLSSLRKKTPQSTDSTSINLNLEKITKNKTQLKFLQNELTQLTETVSSDSVFKQPYFVVPTTSGVVLVIVGIVAVIFVLVRRKRDAEDRIVQELRRLERRSKRRAAAGTRV